MLQKLNEVIESINRPIGIFWRWRKLQFGIAANLTPRETQASKRPMKVIKYSKIHFYLISPPFCTFWACFTNLGIHFARKLLHPRWRCSLLTNLIKDTTYKRNVGKERRGEKPNTWQVLKPQIIDTICSTAKPQLLLQSRMATFDHFKQWFSNSFKLQCRTTKQKRPKVFKGSQLTQKWPPGFWFQLPPRPRRWVPWSWASERPARSRPGGPSGSRRRRCRWTPRCQTATLKPRLKIQKNHKPVSFFNFNSELRCFFEACFVSSCRA